MAKRSTRRVARQDKNQAGCMWGLISMFDFRQGRSTRKLLSDGRHGSRNSAGAATKLDKVMDSRAARQRKENDGKSGLPTTDGQPSVKELIKEEMSAEKGSTKCDSNAESEIFYSCEDIEAWKENECSRETLEEPVDESVRTDLCQKLLGNVELESVAKDLLRVYYDSTDYAKSGLRESSLTQLNWTFPVEEKLKAAIEVVRSQKFSGSGNVRGEGNMENYNEFLDGFQLLSSNKEVFSKLADDPKPPFSRKPSNAARSNSSEEENPRITRPDDFAYHKHRSFFRRTSKSQEINPSKKDKKTQFPSHIVVLKPGNRDRRIDAREAMESRGKAENLVRIERNASLFSFSEIKRKVKLAMGMDHNSTSSRSFMHTRNLQHDKGKEEGSNGWSSPNRNHFYTEKFANVSSGSKTRARISKSRSSERLATEGSSNTNEVSQIYREAKKHLSEMLSNGDESEELFIGKLPKILGTVLSLQSHNMSPACSLGNSPRGNLERTDKIQPCDVNVKSEEESSGSSNPQVLHQIEHDNLSEVEIISNGAMETWNICETRKEDSKTVEVLCMGFANDDRTGELDKERSSQCSKLAVVEEGRLSCSPSASPLNSASPARKSQEPETTPDRVGRPSPVSVLEPLLSEDVISPASTSFQSAETVTQPLHIQFQEITSPARNQELRIGNCMQEEESEFEYVEAVLLASDLNWNEFISNWLTSVRLLNPSLFDEVRLFSNRSSHDQRLLFDCADEMLSSICDRHFSFFWSGLSFEKNLKLVLKGMELIEEVWEGVESNLKNPHRPSLDQLLRKDLGKGRTWMNLWFATEGIVFEMEEFVLEALMEDTVLSFAKECAHRAFVEISA